MKIVKIENFCVGIIGKLEFLVVQEDGDKTQNAYHSLKDCVALDNFYNSRQHKPLFGLKIHLQRAQLLIAKKNSNVESAKFELLEIFKEFITDVNFMNKLELEIKKIGNTDTCRLWLDNWLKNFDKLAKDELVFHGISRGRTNKNKNNNVYITREDIPNNGGDLDVDWMLDELFDKKDWMF